MILLSGYLLQGQVQLEKTYPNSGNYTELDDGECKYFMMDVPNKQCKIYNTDHTLYKSISLPVPEGYFLYDMKYVTRKVFNDDDKIELLYIYYKVQVVNSVEVNYYGMKVITETGDILVNLNDGGFAEIVDVGGTPKLFAWQYKWADYYYLIYTNVYSLGGSNASTVANSIQESLQVYPVPADDHVNIRLNPELVQRGQQIIITDMQGKVRQNVAVAEGTEKLSISTSDLAPGTYVVNSVSENNIQGTAKFYKQ